MEIEKKQAPDGKAFINFKDNLGVPCRMAIGWGDLRFLIYTGRNLPDYAVFTQEQVKSLLPYLQSFAETGTLEPQESPLQGGKENTLHVAYQESGRIEKLEADLEETCDLLDTQKERIQALEELVMEWRKSTFGLLVASQLIDLQKRTNQLLGE